MKFPNCPDGPEELLALIPEPEPEPEPAEPAKPVTLTLNDRCDRCGAQAMLAIHIEAANLNLLLCAHHFKKHGNVLTDEERNIASILCDKRDELLVKP